MGGSGSDARERERGARRTAGQWAIGDGLAAREGSQAACAARAEAGHGNLLHASQSASARPEHGTPMRQCRVRK
jgi:hypothetical protein